MTALRAYLHASLHLEGGPGSGAITRARWQSGHAAACKAVYAGSIPTLASKTLFSAVLTCLAVFSRKSYAVATGRAQHDVAADLKDALAPVKSRNFACVTDPVRVGELRGGRYLFPSLRTRDRPMSENTINAALRRLGYSSEEQTGHGFRSMASTLLNEQGFPPDVIGASHPAAVGQ